MSPKEAVDFYYLALKSKKAGMKKCVAFFVLENKNSYML